VHTRVFVKTSEDPRLDITIEPEDAKTVRPDLADCEIIAFGYMIWIALLSDSPLVPTRGQKPRDVFLRFRRRILSQPFETTVGFYSRLGDALSKAPKYTDAGSSQGQYLKLFEKTPVYREYLEWFRTGDPHLMHYLLSFCQFLKKLKVSGSEELHSLALRQWKDLEERLSNLTMPAFTAMLRAIVDGVGLELDREMFFPKFGPGYVAEGYTGRIEKSRSVNFDRKIDYLFYSSQLNRKESGLGHRAVDVIPHVDRWASPDTTATVASALRFVPKSYKALRTICMEPNTMMYHQQGVYRWYRDALDSSVLRRYVHLEDQTVNQDAARYGSETGLVDTIDLSAASDSVHIDLVKQIFPARILKYLLGTRSSVVALPDGSEVDVVKFAPMGSALCFPIETTVFTIVCIYVAAKNVFGDEGVDALAKRLKKRLVPTLNILFKQQFGVGEGIYEPLRVYGDDIAVDKRLTDDVIHHLTLLGFSVNLEKSFSGEDAYRESCGEHFCWGETVTPVLFKVPVSSWADIGASEYEALIDVANVLRRHGFINARRVLLHLLLHELRTRGMKLFPRFVTNEDDRGILVNFVIQCGDRIRWNTDLQRVESKCHVTRHERYKKPVPDEQSEIDLLRYATWWSTATKRKDVNFGDFTEAIPSVDAVGKRIQWGWTPLD